MVVSPILSGGGVTVADTHTTNLNIFLLLVVLAIVCVSLIRIVLHEFELRYHSLLPESALVIILGALFGCILLLFEKTTGLPETVDTVFSFNPESFFLILIPPILLEAGYFLHKSVFFHDLDLILMYAIIGTMMNTALTALWLYLCGLGDFFNHELKFADSLLFASLISAVDPVAVIAIFEEMHVNEQLYILVFGESVLNDAVSVVLFNVFLAIVDITVTVDVPFLAIAKFGVVSIGGILVGVLFGVLCSFITRFTGHLPLLEPLLVVLTGMCSFIVAEILTVSGIVAILFCGIVMSRYVEANIGRKSHSSLKYLLKVGASTADTLVFVSLGISCIMDEHEWDPAFIFLTIFFILLNRFFVVFVLTLVGNRFVHDKVSLKNQFVIAYGGLRGAIAYALSLLIPSTVANYKVFQTTTLMVVLFTVFIMGTTIKPLLKLLRVKLNNPEPPHISAKVLLRGCHHVADAVLKISGGHSGSFNWKHHWSVIDHVIQKILVKGKTDADTKNLYNLASTASHKGITLERRFSFEEREKRRLSAELSREEDGELQKKIRAATTHVIGEQPPQLQQNGSTSSLVSPSPSDIATGGVIRPMKRRRSIGDIMMQREQTEQSPAHSKFDEASRLFNQRKHIAGRSRWFSRHAIHHPHEDHMHHDQVHHWLPRIHWHHSKKNKSGSVTADHGSTVGAVKDIEATIEEPDQKTNNGTGEQEDGWFRKFFSRKGDREGNNTEKAKGAKAKEDYEDPSESIRYERPLRTANVSKKQKAKGKDSGNGQQGAEMTVMNAIKMAELKEEHAQGENSSEKQKWWSRRKG